MRLRITRTRRTPEGIQIQQATARVGRNDPCPCRSGRKLKHCCLSKITAPTTDNRQLPTANCP